MLIRMIAPCLFAFATTGIAFAQAPGLTMRLQSIRCVEEVNEESAAEEPYILLTVVDFRSTIPGAPALPNLWTRRYGVWDHFDGGDVVNDSGPPFWGQDGNPQNFTNASDVAVIVSLIENDNADPGQYETLVRTVATTAVTGSIGNPNNGARAITVRDALRNALNGVDLPIPFALDDDHIGTQILPIRAADLIPGGQRDEMLSFRNRQGSYDLTFRIERSAERRSFQSVNFPDRFMRHAQFLGEVSPVTTPLDRADSTFVLRPGVSGVPGSISFESVNFPGRYLRHQGFRLKLQANDGTNLFRDDASFMPRPGLADGAAASYESVNLPGHFIRHRGFHLFVERNDGSQLFGRDATFRMAAANQ